MSEFASLTWQKVDELIASHTEEIVSPSLCAEPLVSVIVSCYQHGAFVRQAMDSIVSQKTDFPFEVVVGDDGSSDDSFEILKEYQQLHPEKIRLYRSFPRLGKEGGYGIVTLIRSMRACRGKYIAVLESDDYWTNENKLQIQADLLESNPECSGSFHDVEVVGDWKGEPIYADFGGKERISFEDQLTFETPMAFGSLMAKRKLFVDLPEFFLNPPFLDRYFMAEMSFHGPVIKAPGKMGAYRRHAGGITLSDLMASYEAWHRTWGFYRKLKAHFSPRGDAYYDYMTRFALRFLLRKSRRPKWSPRNLLKTLGAASKMGVGQTILAQREAMGKTNPYARKW